jgi:transposase InsO family protein
MKDYFEINVKKTAYKSPWQNGTIERFNQSLKHEVFESVVPINLNQIQRVCNEYKIYYNENRTHQGINGNIPGSVQKPKSNKTTHFDLKSHLNGLFNTFETSYA